MSDGNETNDRAPVSEEQEVPQPHAPHIQVLRGNPTDDEVAALITVLAGATGGGGAQGEPEFSRWGLPVDKLRYPVFSWQRVTLLERRHLRR